MALASPALDFSKHPISHHHDISSVPALDSELSDQSTSPQPVSLLTLLRTPQQNPITPPNPIDSKTGKPPAPILRRDSISSDAEHGHVLSALTSSLSINHGKEHEPKRALKFAVVQPHLAPLPHPDPRAPTPMMDDSDNSSDGGYQEDEEDGTFSDDDDVFTARIPRAPSPSKYPFARPTNYDHGSRRSSEAPPAPATLPPPSRRGRGHIRVVDKNDTPKTCSRHCSPPPVRSRSGSEAKSRTSDAGPREGRAGSPMPDVSDLPDVDDEAVDESPVEGIPIASRWRRASENLPGFRCSGDRRPSGAELEVTPVVGSTSKHDESVYRLLESSLASSSSLTRARSMGAKVSFAPRIRPAESMSADE